MPDWMQSDAVVFPPARLVPHITSGTNAGRRASNRQCRETSDADGRGVVLAFRAAMDTSATSQASGGLVRRIESEYREMPGLNLTLGQAQRLWGVDHATCVQVLTLL